MFPYTGLLICVFLYRKWRKTIQDQMVAGIPWIWPVHSFFIYAVFI